MPPNSVLLLMAGLALLARPQQKTTFGSTGDFGKGLLPNIRS
jgi:hypothetical protein